MKYTRLLTFPLLYILRPVSSQTNDGLGCMAGEPAVEGVLAIFDSSGGLSDGNFSLLINDEPVPVGGTVYLTPNLYDMSLVADTFFRGIIFRFGGSSPSDLLPFPGMQMATFCGDVGGVTHRGRADKKRSLLSFLIDDGDTFEVDITVVRIFESPPEYYYGRITLVGTEELPVASPSKTPSVQPSASSSTSVPSSLPTLAPSIMPSLFPTRIPTSLPSNVPNEEPTPQPSGAPSTFPSGTSSAAPTLPPSLYPSSKPSIVPSTRPSTSQSQSPTLTTSLSPSKDSSSNPSSSPSFIPSDVPSLIPSMAPSGSPSGILSVVPTASFEPTSSPDATPSSSPSTKPTMVPSASLAPTSSPSAIPSARPSLNPSLLPSLSFEPTWSPDAIPSSRPSTKPTPLPSASLEPTSSPNATPSSNPSTKPTLLASDSPSSVPTTPPTIDQSDVPSYGPSTSPTLLGSDLPSSAPSNMPSGTPSDMPSNAPSLLSQSAENSSSPTILRSDTPSSVPSMPPSTVQSDLPSSSPSLTPTVSVSSSPSFSPSAIPTATLGLPLGCHTNASSIYEEIARQKPTTIIICPSTRIKLETDDRPFTLQTDTTIQCGDSGSLVNNCTIVGGTTHFATVAPVSNAKVMGLILTEARHESVSLDHAGFVVFEDCMFTEHSSNVIIKSTFFPEIAVKDEDVDEDIDENSSTSELIDSSVENANDFWDSLGSWDVVGGGGRRLLSMPKNLQDRELERRIFVPESIPPSCYLTHVYDEDNQIYQDKVSCPGFCGEGRDASFVATSNCGTDSCPFVIDCIVTGCNDACGDGIGECQFCYKLEYFEDICEEVCPATPSHTPVAPTLTPVTDPTKAPSMPTVSPTVFDSVSPSTLPSSSPSSLSSQLSSTSMPSAFPSALPIALPSALPSSLPSALTSSLPSALTSSLPSAVTSSFPSTLASSFPSAIPSRMPSEPPSSLPSEAPSGLTSELPSFSPTNLPSSSPTVTPASDARTSIDPLRLDLHIVRSRFEQNRGRASKHSSGIIDIDSPATHVMIESTNFAYNQYWVKDLESGYAVSVAQGSTLDIQNCCFLRNDFRGLAPILAVADDDNISTNGVVAANNFGSERYLPCEFIAVLLNTITDPSKLLESCMGFDLDECSIRV